MQVRAILSAACELKKEKVNVLPEIMIPLVGNVLRENVLAFQDMVSTRQLFPKSLQLHLS